MHTKGPLIAHAQPFECQTGDWFNYSIQTENGKCVALICLAGQSGSLADIRLWAAATDLLEACQAAERSITELYAGIAPSSVRGDTNGFAESDEVVALLRAAIRKATGAP